MASCRAGGGGEVGVQPTFQSFIPKPPVGPLIDLSDETTDTPDPPETVESVQEVFISKETQEQKLDKSQEKLCGYLNKLGARGPLKNYKRRWFVFADHTCKLLYYRAPQDLVPLGEIDIANASFCFEVGNTEKPGAFEIR